MRRFVFLDSEILFECIGPLLNPLQKVNPKIAVPDLGASSWAFMEEKAKSI